MISAFICKILKLRSIMIRLRVHIGHRVELTDTIITPVCRHYTLHDLEKLPAALELQKHIDGKIVVSPAKSATDEMEVRVETSMESLLVKMEEQVRKMIADEFTTVS